MLLLKHPLAELWCIFVPVITQIHTEHHVSCSSHWHFTYCWPSIRFVRKMSAAQFCIVLIMDSLHPSPISEILTDALFVLHSQMLELCSAPRRATTRSQVACFSQFLSICTSTKLWTISFSLITLIATASSQIKQTFVYKTRVTWLRNEYTTIYQYNWNAYALSWTTEITVIKIEG